MRLCGWRLGWNDCAMDVGYFGSRESRRLSRNGNRSCHTMRVNKMAIGMQTNETIPAPMGDERMSCTDNPSKYQKTTAGAM